MNNLIRIEAARDPVTDVVRIQAVVETVIDIRAMDTPDDPFWNHWTAERKVQEICEHVEQCVITDCEQAPWFTLSLKDWDEIGSEVVQSQSLK